MTDSVVTARVLNQIEWSYVLEGIRSSSPFTGKQVFLYGNSYEVEEVFTITLEPGRVFLSRTPNTAMLTFVGQKVSEYINSKVVNYVSDNLTPTSGDTLLLKLSSLRSNLTDYTLYSSSGEPFEGLTTEKLADLDDNMMLVAANKSLEISIGRHIRLDHEDDKLYVQCPVDIAHKPEAPVYLVDLDKKSKLWDTYKNEWIEPE